MRNRWIELCGVVIATFLSTPLAAQSESFTPKQLTYSGDGYILLDHGNVIHGFIRPHLDHVSVTKEKGTEVSLPNRRILTIGNSIESLYDYQVQAIRRWGTGEHFQLATWCIQNHLLDQAIFHYQQLEKISTESAAFRQLDLQLKQALLADKAVQSALADAGIQVDSRDQNVAAKKTATSGDFAEPQRMTASSTKETMTNPSDDLQNLPSYVRRSFQTEVMPIVVMRCGQAACHGMLGKNDFQIMQPVGEHAASITDRNLASFLKHVRLNDPARSSMLEHAIQPHGMQRNPSLNPLRDEDKLLLDKIARWIQTIAAPVPSATADNNAASLARHFEDASNSSNNVAPAVAFIPRSLVKQQTNNKRAKYEDTMPQRDRNAKLSKPAKSGAPPSAIDAAELIELEGAIDKLEQKAGLASRDQQDPFDPKIFNDRFAPKK